MRQRYVGKSKVKRDSWVRKMADDMPQLTQADIGQKFGIDQSAISRILKGGNNAEIRRPVNSEPIQQGTNPERN